jgi:hypothetical protein
MWDKLANLPGCGNSVQCWESNVEENQVRFKLCRLPNRFEAVGDFRDDLQAGLLPQFRADNLPKGREIVDHDQSC